MHPADFLATAEALLGARVSGPSQADLRKAASIAYYAVFYALCQNAADCLIGAGVGERAWRQAFRALDHGFAKRQCQNQQVMAGFPPGIRFFAGNFISLQEQRHTADYDPDLTLSVDDARTYINEAKQAIDALAAASEKDRHDFAAWVALRHRA